MWFLRFPFETQNGKTENHFCFPFLSESKNDRTEVLKMNVKINASDRYLYSQCSMMQTHSRLTLEEY